MTKSHLKIQLALLRQANAVIPSVVEGSRDVTLNFLHRDPSAVLGMSVIPSFIIPTWSFITSRAIQQIPRGQRAPLFFFTLRHRLLLSSRESFIHLAHRIFTPGLQCSGIG